MEKFKEFKAKCVHEKDSIIPVIFVDPVSVRIVYILSFMEVKGKINKEMLKSLPNFVSFSRLIILSTFLMVTLISHTVFNTFEWMMSLIFFAYLYIFTDSIDGQMARGLNIKSSKGAKIDSVADRTWSIIFIISTFFIGFKYSYILSSMMLTLIILKLVKLSIHETEKIHGTNTDEESYKVKGKKEKDNKETFNLVSGIFKIIHPINSMARFVNKRANVFVSSGYEKIFILLVLPQVMIHYGVIEQMILILGVVAVVYITSTFMDIKNYFK